MTEKTPNHIQDNWKDKGILKKIFADILGYEVQEWIMDLEALGIHSYDLDDLAQTQKIFHCR